MGLKDWQFLQQVTTPARYVGSEINSVTKNPDGLQARFALAYPDAYEIGMSHLGSQILYAVINAREDAWCERVFHPWHDAAALLRERGEPLTTLESGTPLAAFDFLGITLQHELNYTTVLSLLELGRVALRTAKRDPGAPLVVGGGPCVYNPEPIADFFDFFVVGEGEEVIGEILDLYASGDWGRAGQRTAEQRQALLQSLAEIEGVYVPSLGTDRLVYKRFVQDLEAAPVALTPVVPYCEVTHDRGQLEVNRGCTRGCRFCQAGMVYRPVRERTVDTLVSQATAIIDNTGYDEISLVSLNCPDYSHILQLVDRLLEQLEERRVAIGLPSLRTDSFSVELADRIQRVKKTGLTLAPEAGSQCLRDRINKNVTEQDLMEAARAAFSRGWHRLKLYFMIGLPGETDEDIAQIAELVRGVLAVGREELGPQFGRLNLSVSVACFIPKPHTPFQWAAQNSLEELQRKQDLLRESFSRLKRVRLSTHGAEQAVVEGLLARGGRELCDLVEAVYHAGGVFEAWDDEFRLGRWLDAGREKGLDVMSEAARARCEEEALPWEHIHCGVDVAYLRAEWSRAQQEKTTDDCRDGVCRGCGLRERALVCSEAGGEDA